MTKAIPPFFNGVVLAAEQAWQAPTTTVLRQDARELGHVHSQLRIPARLSPRDRVARQCAVVDAWLEYRRQVPSGELGTDVKAVVKHLSEAIASVKRVSRFEHLLEVQQGIPDKQFSHLIDGAQVGLMCCLKQELSGDLLSHDWQVIRDLYPQVLNHYEEIGVPSYARPILMTQEYIAFRIDKALSPLIFVDGLLGGEARFGFLEVYTKPTAGKVSVDMVEWGESPAKNGLRAGSHHVLATKGKLKGERDVTVKAASFNKENINMS